MTSAVQLLVLEHAHNLVDPIERTVDIPFSVQDDFMVAMAEDGENIEDMILHDCSMDEYVTFFADMMRAFSGKLSHSDFFKKYAPFYERGQRLLSEDWQTEIWNAYVDEFNPPPFDPYDCYGVKRSDF